MKYKLIIFDLDGVLIDTKILHYKALNEALGLVDEKYCISESEHLLEYDGLKTFQKLNLLTERKNLPVCEHSKIWDYKQRFTLKSLADTEPNLSLKELLCKLTNDGYKIGCCSNSIRKTVLLVLAKLGIIEYFDVVLSNDDVRYCKPHPEMYWKCMSEIGVLPAETLIIEDSPVGLLGAKRSGASVMRIDSPHQLCYDKINIMLNKSKNTESIKWKGEDLNVLIPMAGAGSRFEAAGYTFPKPLIEVNGKPMIQVVVENLNVEANFIFVVNKTHRSKYNLDVLLNLISPNCRIVEAEGLTEGAACTTLLAKEYINNGASLLIANSDQFVEWNSVEFMYKMIEQRVDSGILTFTSTHPKWSFCQSKRTRICY